MDHGSWRLDIQSERVTRDYPTLHAVGCSVVLSIVHSLDNIIFLMPCSIYCDGLTIDDS
jgi:hypothetical protein